MKNLDYALLLDIYGSMLTEKQRNFMELYYWEDLSLGEMSQTEGVSRQAVRDSIKRSEQILTAFEQSLGIAEKISACRDIFSEIKDIAENGVDKEKTNKIKELAEKGIEIF